MIVREVARAPKLAKAEVAIATYHDRPAMVAALHDIETVFFVSAFESEDRLKHHLAAIRAFVDAGVQRVVYTSFLNASPTATFTFARHHAATEDYLAEAGLRFAALRNSLYMDLLPSLVSEGAIRGPAGEGRFAPVARDDIAEVAAALLNDDAAPDGPYDVTGPALMTMQDVAEQLSEASGQPVVFENETEEEAYAARTGVAPDYEVAGWVSSYLAIARGELETVSDTVERLTGRPATSFKEFLAQRKS